MSVPEATGTRAEDEEAAKRRRKREHEEEEWKYETGKERERLGRVEEEEREAERKRRGGMTRKERQREKEEDEEDREAEQRALQEVKEREEEKRRQQELSDFAKEKAKGQHGSFIPLMSSASSAATATPMTLNLSFTSQMNVLQNTQQTPQWLQQPAPQKRPQQLSSVNLTGGVNWEAVEKNGTIEKEVAALVGEKVKTFLGTEDKELVSFIITQVRDKEANNTPKALTEKLKEALGDEAEDFVTAIWNKLVNA